MIHLLEKYYWEAPEKTAFVLYDPQKDDERKLTYKQLADFSQQLGLQLLDNGFFDKTAILIYNNVLQFIIAFFACQYAGIIPIPVLFSNSKRQIEKILQIQHDSGAQLLLSDETLKNIVEKQFGALIQGGECRLYCIPTMWEEKKSSQFNKTQQNPVAFIQYTSGSTGAPKGVVVSQKNLAHNHLVISEAFMTDSESVLFSWLPFQHDMGLVGIILQSFFIGSTAVLMSPLSFMQQPISWLQGITKYRATHSGAPNFAFDYCIARIKPEELKGLDLSSWRLAFNGSQPVRYETIKKFAEYFGPAGFSADAMYPCYGLAEATLMVTGGKRYKLPLVIERVSEVSTDNGLQVNFSNRKMVSCGLVSDKVDVIIYRYDTICNEMEEGEILVAGESVTSGYWNRGDADMFKVLGNKKYLKTGDWGFLQDGELFVCGRLKEMLIVRGVNIYPYEIEQKLSEIETSCEENGVAIFQSDSGMGDEIVVVAEIKRSLQRSIPLDRVVANLNRSACELIGVVPFDVVLVQSLGIPRTSSGKIKRLETGKMYREGRLPLLVSKRTLTPLNYQVSEPGHLDLDAEEDLQGYLINLIASKTNGLVLCKSDFATSFFSFGIDSLRLAEIINTINNDLKIQLDIESIAYENTLAHVLKNIQTRVWAKNKPVIADGITFTFPTQRNIKDDYPATGAQKRLWVLSQFEKASSAYNIVVRFNVKGELNVSKLQFCFDELRKKHEILRTVFRFVKGELRQVVKPDIHLAISKQDISEMSSNDQKEFVELECHRIKNRLFNLENGPLVGFHLIKIGCEENIMAISAHHLVTDGWSLGLMIQQLLANYGQLNTIGQLIADDADFQYGEYSVWQQENTDLLRLKHADFWKQYIPSEPVYLELPLMNARSGTRSSEGNKARFYIGNDFYNPISQFCNTKGFTLFNFFRATLAILLSKITGQGIIPIGVPVSGRTNTQVEKGVGMFVNTLPLFSSCKDDIPFIEFLIDTANDSLQALSHQDYPFDRILDDLNFPLDRSRNPLFDVMMVFNDAGVLPGVDRISKAAGLEITSTDGWLYNYMDYELEDVGTQMDLSFIFGAEPGGYFYIDVEYCVKLFDKRFIQNIIHYYRSIIKQVLALPEMHLGTIGLMTAEDEQAVFEKFNQTHHSFDDQATLTELFERRVKETPQAVAVMGEEGSLTYSALNETTNKLANYIRSKYEVRPDTPVALKMERGQWMLISILAVLKAGGAYLPISPDYPEERIAYILENSDCNIVLDTQVIANFRASQAAYSGNNVEKKHTSQNLAYIIYTSGSTGLPKGCMLEHRGVVNRLEWMWNELEFDYSDIILQKTTFSFDVSVWELLMPVCYGAKMVLCKNEDILSPTLLAGLVYKYKVTCMHFVPSALSAFLEFGFDQTSPHVLLNSLRKIICSGEVLPVELVHKWKRTTALSIPLYNLYGPTEASIDVTSYKVQEPERIVSIGKPIWNTQIFILNNSGQLQPPGITGELYLGGIGLARGYINNRELTAEHFLPNPFFKGHTMYKTGDIGRWLPDGNIEYLGRKDNQVKIRGHRIELGEIERALLSHADIKESAVVVRTNSRKENEIAAFIVAARDLTVPELREYLRAKLPQFMVPENYIQLPALPLSKNGKIDKGMLRNFRYSNLGTGSEFSVPTTEVEKSLIQIWKRTLEREEIGVHDNFFDLGGNSLKLLKVVEQINKDLGTDLPVVKLFQFPTVTTLAKFMSADKAEPGHEESEDLRSRSVKIMEQTLNLINNDRE